MPSWQQKPFAVFAAIWQHRDLLTEKMSSSLQTPSCRQRHDRGDSRFLVVGTMAMCVQLLTIRYKIAIWFEWVDSNSNLADGFRKMVRKLLGHWISFGITQNSKVFPSQSHWLRCENNSFQNLLTIDQTDQLVCTQIGLLPWTDCAKSEHSFSLAFCSVSAVPISPHHMSDLSVGPWQPYFGIFLHHRVQLRLESLCTISCSFSLCFGTFSPFCVKRENCKRLFV